MNYRFNDNNFMIVVGFVVFSIIFKSVVFLIIFKPIVLPTFVFYSYNYSDIEQLGVFVCTHNFFVILKILRILQF